MDHSSPPGADMQDLQSITNAGGGGGGGGGDASRISGGDRRVRPYPNQPLKCPRCDSLNTKFCYYNNYNLSQPRHFCKSCRRYWTKGGVLRNVPVGGGCRKTKRSNKPKPSSDPHTKLGRIIKNMNTSAAAATAPSSTANPP
ncbi:hypothetical protein Sjap_015382 [Stephania japonica]|uniref:Dof zinc finger protein n=1 Tax=Stephania japonica TaxID=461633 RepID=A0AAP0IJG9_9MAGN